MFASKIEEGYTLDQVAITQPPFSFPLFIPTYTQKYRGAALPLRWVAVDVRNLLNPRRTREAILNPHFADETRSRDYLRVDGNCQLLAVLNGQDWMLESFWAMQRPATLQQLRASGFEVGTGATYSVMGLTTEGTAVPYAHHTAMLMRHHRVLDEMQRAGIAAIPNLYWLDGDRRELARWSDWLRSNSAISTVSRDFTSTSQWSVISPKVDELVLLLRNAGRQFHILIVGTGRANAPRILHKLVMAGHTATIVTSAPIMKALSGVKYDIDSSGVSSEGSSNRLTFPFPLLIEHNLAVFENILFHVIAGTSAAQQAVRNFTPRVGVSTGQVE